MLSFRIINRNIQNKIVSPSLYKTISQTYCSGSDSDNEKVKKSKPGMKERKIKSEETLQKLNILLKKMIEDDSHTATNKLNLARPKPRAKNDKNEPNTISAKSESVEKKVIYAAKNVAQSLGGNTKQTESELLSKLLNTNVSGNEQESKSLNLSDVISGMKIDRTVKPNVNNEVSRAHQVRQLLDKTSGRQRSDSDTRPISRVFRKPKYVPQTDIEKINLFGSKPLGIFTSAKSKETEKESTQDVTLKTWNALLERELRLTVTHPPENYFQEMILWTNQGKLWKFPIDNEQGMEEQNVYFAEHIFLEKHLENWCPTKGPIRHFMELVCVGLSKNPYLSAEAKKDHIMWYKNYFLSKQQLLEEIGAMPATTKPKEIEQ